jgi:pentatricopeptide repeat protein
MGVVRKLFNILCEEGVEVNEVTFICFLSACSHAGLVDEGLHYISLMVSDYNISVNWEHYACMVDILGCSGLLGEAEDLIKTMPCDGWPCLVLAEFMGMWRRQNRS